KLKKKTFPAPRIPPSTSMPAAQSSRNSPDQQAPPLPQRSSSAARSPTPRASSARANSTKLLGPLPLPMPRLLSSTTTSAPRSCATSNPGYPATSSTVHSSSSTYSLAMPGPAKASSRSNSP